MPENRYRAIVFVFLLALICIPNEAIGQEFINTRKITMNRGDTTIVAGILADIKLETVQQDALYFWYSNSGVFSNQGGFSGNLLHGEYLEYEAGGNLILKGYFNRGLKTGIWVYWYTSGGKMKEVEYKEGKLNGNLLEYSQQGKILYSAEYRNDLLHGSKSLIINDTLFNVQYRNGIQIRKKVMNVFSESQK